MIKLLYTYRIYKKFSNPVLGRPSTLNQTGFFNLKINSGTKMYGFGGSFPSGWQVKTVSPFHYFNTSINNPDQDRSLLGGPFLFTKIKGRVERDCLNVSENKTEILSNTYSAKAGLPAPTSEDNSCMMRVIKETGIEKCGRPENEGRPIKVRNNDSKLTLKFNLFYFFTEFHL